MENSRERKHRRGRTQEEGRTLGGGRQQEGGRTLGGGRQPEGGRAHILERHMWGGDSQTK